MQVSADSQTAMLKQLGIFVFLSIFILGKQALSWDYSKHSIPLEEIYSGGPPKDGIPALTEPEFITAEEAGYLNPEDRVLGIYLQGEAKAYPMRILNWHEIVNDTVGGKAVVVSYCPLTGSGVAFEANINEKRVLFGVSGNLYNSNVLLYDRDTESLWSQLKMEAVTGEMTGARLKQIPVISATWQDWKARFPSTRVLALDTGYSRNYSRDPYQDYARSEITYFPVTHKIRILHPKDLVLGVIIDGQTKTYPFNALQKVTSPLRDRFAGQDILVYYNQKQKSAWVESQTGEIIPAVQAYWFAWYAFYPETEVFSGVVE